MHPHARQAKQSKAEQESLMTFSHCVCQLGLLLPLNKPDPFAAQLVQTDRVIHVVFLFL